MKSLRNAYKTSAKLETDGVIFETGNTRVRLRRAGGANTAFNIAMVKVAKDHKRAIDLDLMGEEKANRLLYELYAEHVVVSWETNVGSDERPEWVDGIDDGNGGVIPATFDNVVATFTDIPDYFAECKSNAESLQYYREALIAQTVKN